MADQSISKILKRGLYSPFFPLITFLLIILGISLGLALIPNNITSAWQPGCKIGSEATLGLTVNNAVNLSFSSEDLVGATLKNTNLRVGFNTDNCYGFTAQMSSVDEDTGLKHRDAGISQKINSISTDSLGVNFATKHWGYRVEDGSGTQHYKPIPKLSMPGVVHAQAAPGSSGFDLNFAVKAAPDLMPGVYSKDLLLTLTTNHATTKATFLPGPEFANIAKSIVGTENMERFERSSLPPAIYGQPNPDPSEVARYPKVSTLDSDTPIYLWRDGKKILWWADTDMVYTNENCEAMFKEVSGYTYDINLGLFVDMRGIDTSRTKNMKSMFAYTWYKDKGYAQVNGLDLSEFDTSNAETMELMFSGVVANTGVNLSRFNTSQVTNMKGMFSNSNITNLNLDSFNTSKVTDMSQMFLRANAINLNFSGFNTSRVTDMSKMFSSAQVRVLDISGFDTSEVTNMSEMFANVNRNDEPELTLSLNNFNTSKVTDMSGMFASNKIVGLSAHSFDTSQVTNMSLMFAGTGISSLNLSFFDTSKVTNMFGMFSGTRRLTSINLSNFDTSRVEDMGYMFGSSSLPIINLYNFDTRSVKNMSYMFHDLPNTTSLDLSNFNTSKVENMRAMFSGSNKLNNINLTSFNTSKVKQMQEMFSHCESMTSYSLLGFDTREVIDMSNMFYGNSSLNTLNLSSFHTGKVTDMSSMFSGTKNLTNLMIPNFDTGNVIRMTGMFSQTGLTTLDLSHFNTEKVLYMSDMFSLSSNLTNLNLTGFNTRGVLNMSAMFRDTTSLTELDLSSFDTQSVNFTKSMFMDSGVRTIKVAANQFNMQKISTKYGDGSDYMFSGAVNLVGGNGTAYHPSYPRNKEYAHIDAPGNPGYFTLKQ